MKRYLIILLALLMVLNTSIVLATQADYDKGYEAGLADGEANREKETSASAALRAHKETSAYPRDSLVDPEDYDEGYYEGYAEGKKEPEKVDYAIALGKALGEISGARDYQEGNKSDWEDALPSDREIRSMFDLSMQDGDYRESFIDAFTSAFQEAYIGAYEKAQFEPAKTSLSQGQTDGKAIGKLLGEAYGFKDYYEGRKLDYTRDLPSERVIIAEYSLNNDSDVYKEGFLSGFVSSYEIEYNKAYRKANLESTNRVEKSAIADGKAIGSKLGESQASLDYMSKLPNDWKRSLPKEDLVIREYSLELQTPNYREGFISGFYDGYSEGYNKTFNSLSQNAGIGKTYSENIPLAGGVVSIFDNALEITIDQGTYYHPVQLSINTTYDVGNLVVSSLVKASDSYRVSILNTSGNLNNTKPIKLSFEYYGDRLRGGIYKLAKGFWTYIPSEVEEGRIVAYVNPDTISASGNVYGVFLDTGAKYFADARGHWAKYEIETYVRRNIIYGYPDGTFKPDRNITRAEFLWLLSRMNRWQLPYYPVNEKLFTDFNTFGPSSELINYAYAQGYITGYPDGSFKPNNNISYSEIQTIMGRVTGKYDFKWLDIAKKMLHEEKVRSTSYDDINNKITRVEVVYMLYNLTESMY